MRVPLQRRRVPGHDLILEWRHGETQMGWSLPEFTISTIHRLEHSDVILILILILILTSSVSNLLALAGRRPVDLDAATWSADGRAGVVHRPGGGAAAGSYSTSYSRWLSWQQERAGFASQKWARRCARL
jgi:hypothetical protein